MVAHPVVSEAGSAAAKIFIVTATERVSGPLKGIFQYLPYLDRERYRPLLGILRAGRPEPSDAEREAWVRGIPAVVLEQNSTFDRSLFRQAFHVSQEQKVGVVQTHSYKPHFLGFALKRRMGLRWIGFEHGWTAETWRVQVYQRIGCILLRQADHVVAVSARVKEQLTRLGVPGRTITRIHNAVEPNEGWSNSPPGAFRRSQFIPLDSPLVAVIGRISPEKGQAMALQAIQRLVPCMPNLKAVFVGEGPGLSELRRRVEACSLQDHVRVLGYQRPLSALYRDADVVCIPSLTEGIPNVLLEAMVSGCPVVATSVGGIPEIVRSEEHALLVQPGDQAGLASAISRVLTDRTLRDRLVEAARQRVTSHHDPRHRAAAIGRIYEAVRL